MRAPIDQLIRQIGYTYTDTGILEVALTHRSAGSQNNERLEFLGDAILGFVIADYLYSTFTNASEGELSRLRASLVKGDSLAEIARDLHLGGYLNLGVGELRSGGQSRSSILADSLEAIIASIYLDGGYEAAKTIILKLFARRLRTLNTNSQQKDPKTRLQEHLQARKIPLPSYTVIAVEGEQHNQSFTVTCRIDKLDINAEGKGASRKHAEQAAAGTILEQILNV